MLQIWPLFVAPPPAARVAPTLWERKRARPRNTEVSIDRAFGSPPSPRPPLREHFKLTGTKFGCGVAQCGTCTVHLDGEPTRSCSVQMSNIRGKQVTPSKVCHRTRAIRCRGPGL